MQEPKQGPGQDDKGTHVPNRFANRDDETEMIERDPAERPSMPGGSVWTLYPDENELESVGLSEAAAEERDRQKQKKKEVGDADRAATDSQVTSTAEGGREDAEEDRVRSGDRKRGREGHP
jgi:hypothetical protein